MPRLSKIGAAALAAFGWTGLSSVSASYLQVAGGGGGGNSYSGGGGGAGGLLTGTVSLNPALSYTVIVGAGGGVSSNGSNSQFGTLTASVGGGNGAVNAFPTAVTGGSGGSGGGGSYGSNGGSSGISGAGGSATSGQGNIGSYGYTNPGVSGAGGGGGGAGSAATNSSSGASGNGGNGTASSITGSSVTYAGGGGGGGFQTYITAGTGGTGGGGAGGVNSAAISGTANLGGGGGGAGYTSGVAGAGGSGVVIISYLSPQKFGGGVVTTSGSNTIHTFTTSGTLSPLSSLTASALIVAGGGGGSGLGGGGGGGLQSITGQTIDTNSTYVVTVGAGGAGSPAGSGNNQGTSGANSVFSIYATASVGGGAGAGYIGGGGSGINGLSGGSGGGGGGANSSAGTGGSATSGQGNIGGNGGASGGSAGGGGGGAGAAGTTAPNTTTGGNGGNGTASSISGTSTTYAGGGGATGSSSNGTAGTGGGGIPSFGGVGGNGTANLGGGGGACYGATNGGGTGGSGVVIISYAGSVQQMAGGTVTISGGNVIHTFTSSGYLTPLKFVGNSLRFRSSASAQLTRTPTVAGTNTKMTFSFWTKRGQLSKAFQNLITSGASAGNGDAIIFTSGDAFRFWLNGGSASDITTSAVYRDPAAWYHIVVAIDTTQATAANRVSIYVNGTQVTAFSSASYPNQNYAVQYFNTTTQQQIGYGVTTGNGGNYYDGYMTEVNFIDGQALTPNSFGTFNSYGVWQPITYGGSYGTNGFYLPFNNPSTVTTSQSVNYLVVAGGGGGGQGNGGGYGCGGGGAGGLLTGTTTVNPATSYTITVGSGGAAGVSSNQGGDGGSSSAIGISTTGGGGGGSFNTPAGRNGGSGGGGGGGNVVTGTGGTGVSGQGFAGGTKSSSHPNCGGGGGGAGSVGADTPSGSVGGNGGSGVTSSISGTSVGYAGGGGGGGNGTAGTATSGGGAGANGAGAAGNGTNGTGGGGGASPIGTTGRGGDGVVIISYSGAQKFVGGTVTSSGGNTIHTFTSSGTLSSSIFADNSPNNNNWTPNNISLTSGSTYDSMTDVPTLTSATVANYAVLNPLQISGVPSFSGSVSKTFTNGNLNIAWGTGSYCGVTSTFIVPSSGKWYWECTLQSANISTGISPSYSEYPSGSENNIRVDGSGIYTNGLSAQSGLAGYTTGDVLGMAWNADTNSMQYYKNGSTYGTAQSYTKTTGVNYFPFFLNSTSVSSQTANVNFGQQPFSYTPPTNFVALNTFNL